MSVLLRMEEVVAGYGRGDILRGLNLSLEEGTITCLVGPNGSGKTTVFNLLTGYLRADAGSVAFAGRRVKRPEPTRLARAGLTRTFQQARIFPDLTLVENMVAAVQLPWHAVVRRRVQGAERRRALGLLEEFGLARLAADRAGTLSYGQKKLLEFATVLMGEPRLVLLDEPTAGVNPVLVEQIERRIGELNAGGLTFLVVEHNMNLVMRLCDPVVVLDHGTKLAEGPPAAVQRDARVLDAYLGA